MTINSNIAALQTSNTLLQNEDKLKKSIKKLSSGKSITTAADDSSGLAISEKMKAQIRGLDQAASNVVEAGSLLSTAESNIETITELMQRMRELTVKAANENTGFISNPLHRRNLSIQSSIQFKKRRFH